MSEQPSKTTGRGPRRREASQFPSDYMLARYRGRVLDPNTDAQLPDQDPIRPTVYVTNELLLQGDAMTDDGVPPLLAQAATEVGMTASVAPEDQELVDLARQAGLEELAKQVFVVRVRLAAAGDGPAHPPDAWRVLQRYRALTAQQPKGAKAGKYSADVSLNHLLTATANVTPARSGPVWDGGGGLHAAALGGGLTGAKGPVWDGGGVQAPGSEFGVPGFGGRSPVAWLGEPPFRHDPASSRRPVVAILDTGVGQHPWLNKKVVCQHAEVGSLPIGLAGEDDGTSDDDPLTGVLDSAAGHGTFIAGLIHQTCPDAEILSVRVMKTDGAVAKFDVLQALNRLVLRQAIAQRKQTPDGQRLPIDVISLSMGYYHEQPGDAAFDELILRPLRKLGEMGVVIVASAGNDATDRHMYPAGFAPHSGSQLPARRNAVPVVSVGAYNPAGRSRCSATRPTGWCVTAVVRRSSARCRRPCRVASSPPCGCGWTGTHAKPSTSTTSAVGSASGAGRRSPRPWSPGNSPLRCSRATRGTSPVGKRPWTAAGPLSKRSPSPRSRDRDRYDAAPRDAGRTRGPDVRALPRRR